MTAPERNHNLRTAELLRDAARLLEAIAQGLTDEDDFIGVVASEGLANAFAALPSHVRHAFIERLDDEAARSYRADLEYQAVMLS